MNSPDTNRNADSASGAPPGADRSALYAACAPKRISSYGSHPWAIVHEPSGNVVSGPPEVLDYGLGSRAINGPSYFTSKRDAAAALARLRELFSLGGGK